MVLAQWLERGLGQLLAPDDSYDSQADVIDTASPVWQMLAPDPNFSSDKTSSSSAPPPHAFRQQQQQFSTPASAQFSHGGGSGGGGGGASASAGSNQQWTGTCQSPNDLPRALQEEIVKASFDTAHMVKRNGKYRNDAKNLFAYALQKKAPDKKVKDKLVRLLQNDLQQHRENVTLLDNDLQHAMPPLYEARSFALGPACPDGLTPLQAAARSGAYDVALILLQLGIPQQQQQQNDNDNDGSICDDKMLVLRHQLQRTNLYGQTAKHLAAQFHREDMVDLIQQHEQLVLNQSQQHNNPFSPVLSPPEDDAKIDVMGRTPWGTLMTSPPPRGRTNTDSASLRNKLFSPKDKSLIGSPAPALLRTEVYHDIHTVHGTATINGTRGFTEDALYFTQWQYSCNNNNNNNIESCGFFIVCDGHGDCGAVATFVSRKLPQVLRQAMENMSKDDDSLVLSHDDWTSLCTTACSSVDMDVKKRGLVGGSVAVFCLVTKDQIVVGNVGDCRCILVEHKETLNSDEDDDGKAAADAAAAAGGQESGDTSVDKLADSMNQQLSLSTDSTSPAVASPPPPSESLLAVTTAGGKMTVVATALSTDHKGDLPDERERVEKAGLQVKEVHFQDEHGNDCCRIKVELSEGNMVDFSRSFGDFDYKDVKGLSENEQPIISVPELRIIDRHSIATESYLVLACDGVWDVKSNDDVANFVTEKVHLRLAAAAAADVTGDDDDILPSVGDDLINSCIDSNDNLSTIIVALSQAADMVSSHQRRRRHSMSSSSPFLSLPSTKLPFSTPQK